MSSNKSFSDRRDEDRDTIVSFWSSFPGVVTGVVIVLVVVGTFIWSAISDLSS